MKEQRKPAQFTPDWLGYTSHTDAPERSRPSKENVASQGTGVTPERGQLDLQGVAPERASVPILRTPLSKA